jgi:ligand-binding sensor protein
MRRFCQQQPQQPTQQQQQQQAPQQRQQQATATPQPPPFVGKTGLYTLSAPYVTDLFLSTTETAQE